MDLEGERCACGEDFEEEGEAWAEFLDGGGAEFRLGVGCDEVGERVIEGVVVRLIRDGAPRWAPIHISA